MITAQGLCFLRLLSCNVDKKNRRDSQFDRVVNCRVGSCNPTFVADFLKSVTIARKLADESFHLIGHDRGQFSPTVDMLLYFPFFQGNWIIGGPTLHSQMKRLCVVRAKVDISTATDKRPHNLSDAKA